MTEEKEQSKTRDEAVDRAAHGSATPFLDEIHAIEMMHSDANTRMDRLLKSRGWKSTSSTPGCRWMLEKQMPDGRTLLTDTDTALRYEMENCDEREREAHDNEQAKRSGTHGA